MFVSVVILVSSCYYDVQEELNPVTGVECDTSDVSYATDIQPIFEANCFTCHSEAAALGGVVLEGYDNVQVVANDGRLLGAVNHESGFTPMPQDAPQLGDCNLAMINAWVNAGALNN